MNELIIAIIYMIFGTASLSWHNDIISDYVKEYHKRRSYYEDNTPFIYLGFWVLYLFLWPFVIIWDITNIIKRKSISSLEERKKLKEVKENIYMLEAKKLETEIRILEENGEL